MDAHEGIEALVNTRGWTLMPPPPGTLGYHTKVRGRHDDHTVEITVQTGEELTTKVHLEDYLPVSFSIGQESLLTKLGHLVGKHDVEVGDPEFDATFRIKSEDPEWTRRLLTPELRAALQRVEAER